MLQLKNSRNYIVIKDRSELKNAQKVDICGYIILEDSNAIYIWTKLFGKWVKEKYVFFGKNKDKDDEVTGLKAYQSFYHYCGEQEVEKMKHIFKPIPMWESVEQMHFANIEFVNTKIYKNIYEFDANSAFTYGTLQLPKGFEKLKDYMTLLYDSKKNSQNQITRSKYKNMQNFLIGYFARIKEFIKTRSEIIRHSNENIQNKMVEIIKNKGNVYISNTDSIVTDEIGAEIMNKYLKDEVGYFKLSTKTDRLFYKSSNAYQLGEKIVYSGVKYFARKHTDFFKEEYAEQEGSLIKPFCFEIENSEEEYSKLCKVEYGKIEVTVYNKIGELINNYIYKIGE